MNNFEIDILPLNYLIKYVSDQELQSEFSFISHKYREDLAKNPSSIEEIEHLVKLKVKKILSLISKNYRTTLLDNYFTEDGLIFYIYSNLCYSFDISENTTRGLM